jgi:hypothetical protein
VIHNIQDATTFDDVEISVPIIYATVEDHQASMAEVGGKLAKQFISILIDLGSNLIYVVPQIVDSCAPHKCKNKKPCLVQLAIRTKRKVSELVIVCPLEMNGMITRENLNILSLGSYDVLINMDWLVEYKVELVYYNKTFYYVDDHVNSSIVRGISKSISLTQVLSLQMKKIFKKGCQLYVFHVLELALESATRRLCYASLIQRSVSKRDTGTIS